MAEAQAAFENQSPQQPWTPKTKFGALLDRFFHIGERGSNIVRELLGGLVIFLAMFYILPLNAAMLSSNWAGIAAGIPGVENVKVIGDVTYILLYGDTWATVAQVNAAVFAATAISASVTTILMGLIGKLPIGLASGLGLNSLIAFNVLLGLGYNFAQSMCVVLIDGILFLIISITPLRAWIVRAIPKSLKIAISAGIGFFIAFIGLQNTGIIVDGATLVTLGSFKELPTLMGLIGIIIILAISALPEKNRTIFWIKKFGVIITIVIMGVICGAMGTAGVPGFAPYYDSSYHLSEIGNFGKIFGSVFRGFDCLAKPSSYALIFALLFTDFFDTTGTLVGVEQGAGMINEDGTMTVSDRGAMVVDAIGTCFGAVCGTTTVTSFVESTTGVAAGARTGLAAVTTGGLFGLSLLIYPALSMFSTPCVTGLALVYVGICMFSGLKDLDWKDWVAVGSTFLTVRFMTVSYSISDGIAAGFLFYTVLTAVSGKFTKKDITVAACTVAFVAIFVMKYLTGIF